MLGGFDHLRTTAHRSQPIEGDVENPGRSRLEHARLRQQPSGALHVLEIAPHAARHAVDQEIRNPCEGRNRLRIQRERALVERQCLLVPLRGLRQMLHRGAGLGGDQLNVHSKCGVDPAHAAFQHVAHAELAADLPYIGDLALVGVGRLPRDHERPDDARQVGGQVVSDGVGQVIVLAIGGQVLERQYYDGQPRRRRGHRGRHSDCGDRWRLVLHGLGNPAWTLEEPGRAQPDGHCQ